MNDKYKRHLIHTGDSIKSTLPILNKLSNVAVLFVTDKSGKLIGSLTDGDIRRGLMRGVSIEQPIDEIIQSNPKFITKYNYDIQQLIEYRNKNFKIIPVVDKNKVIIDIINFSELKSYLPVDVIIMAGGRGSRLQPYTDTTPKPLLKVGEKPILEHNLDRIVSFGIRNVWISLNYLGEQIESYFGNGSEKSISINYLWEKHPLGTAGAAANIEYKELKHQYILLTNSDLLTNLDYEEFFLSFTEQDADFAVVTIPYKVNIPYAVLDTKNGWIYNFAEKPTYTYYSNGGIYLMKKEVLNLIPKNTFFDTPDLMKKLIENKMKVFSHPFNGYWLDIGKHDDFEKAQEDILHLKL
ncbi:MAG: nucleotidyltransferase family protein [Chitinophagales bacterium]|nr:nucleotidyltransferase family protein [Chitinophagales bacterium]